MNALRFTMCCAVMLIATGCSSAGGGGGEGDDASSPEVGPPPVANLGARGVPGYDLQLDHPEGLTAGAVATVALTVVTTNQLPPPMLVKAALGSDEPGTWQAGTAAADGWTWTWTLALPADLTDQRVWLEVTDADGNVSRTGGDDFALQP